MFKKNTTHLRQLELESIYIIREVIGDFKNPVMLYSIGKNSSVMLHLVKKSFFPGNLPFPLLHIDTGWKFKEMYDFRDYIVKKCKIDLIVHSNIQGKLLDLNPFKDDSIKYNQIMKTEGLKEAINKYKFDVIFDGMCRDEEKLRLKKNIYSFHDSFHQWHQKKQCPKLWWNYNSDINQGENIYIFPLSNWTELDIWQYIFLENIEIVSLYFSSIRSVIKRNELLLVINDNRIDIFPNEKILKKMVRFCALGCWPLTSAIESNATTIPEIILELLSSKINEYTI